MSGGSSIPYGNVKNMFILSCAPSGTGVSATSITMATGGAMVTFTVPGLLPGDLVIEANRPSNTVNGNTAPAVPWVGIGNMYVSSAGVLAIQLVNTSTLAVTTPIENYTIGVGRVDGTVTPSGFY